MASAHYKLTYFDLRGLGEVSRYLLTLGSANWEDNRLPIEFRPDGNHNRPEFDALKASGKLPFGQVPILEVEGEEGVIAQSKAIEHHLARTFGLFGSTPRESALIHSFSEGLSDLRIEYVKANWWSKPEEKEALLAKFYDEHLPKHFGLLDKNVVQTASPNIADAQLYGVWESVTSAGKVGDDFLDAYPHLKARINLFKANPLIATYLANRKVTAV